jgi:hypothetical protein
MDGVTSTDGEDGEDGEDGSMSLELFSFPKNKQIKICHRATQQTADISCIPKYI